MALNTSGNIIHGYNLNVCACWFRASRIMLRTSTNIPLPVPPAIDAKTLILAGYSTPVRFVSTSYFDP